MPITYIAKQGDCISSIAFEYGLFPDTIWNNPANFQLKADRQDPNVLRPGDCIVIPDKRLKEVQGLTEARHRFRRLGVPAMLDIQFLDVEDKPRAGLPYRLDIDGRLLYGTTTSDGLVSVRLPPNAKIGHLFLAEDPDSSVEEEYVFHLGHLDPVDFPSGIQTRLQNAGFYDGVLTGVLDEATLAALRSFQKHADLEVSGALNQATKDALRRQHGS
jgi:hypothetical protein